MVSLKRLRATGLSIGRLCRRGQAAFALRGLRGLRGYFPKWEASWVSLVLGGMHQFYEKTKKDVGLPLLRFLVSRGVLGIRRLPVSDLLSFSPRKLPSMVRE